MDQGSSGFSHPENDNKNQKPTAVRCPRSPHEDISAERSQKPVRAFQAMVSVHRQRGVGKVEQWARVLFGVGVRKLSKFVKKGRSLRKAVKRGKCERVKDSETVIHGPSSKKEFEKKIPLREEPPTSPKGNGLAAEAEQKLQVNLLGQSSKPDGWGKKNQKQPKAIRILMLRNWEKRISGRCKNVQLA